MRYHLFIISSRLLTIFSVPLSPYVISSDHLLMVALSCFCIKLSFSAFDSFVVQ
ncbi:hypothetical protein BDB01DRAFT_806960 [Pilobolus umbonatus]|nr:hypothetical protein BDB01DRAFT_806960 [Pilobolus umbonatus]